MSAYETTIQYEDEQPGEAVTEAVAEATDTDEMELPPLYSVVDVGALGDLFRPTRSYGDRPTGHVTFRYAGCEVRLSASGRVTVEP